MNKVQSIKNWYPVLGWNNMPNFSDCHPSNHYQKFREEYYLCEELLRLELNITEALKNDRRGNFRLVGPAGSGKTTFVYYLMKKSLYERNEIFEKYFTYIFHSNKADHPDYITTIRDEIFNALEKYFSLCGFKEDFDRITDEEHISKKDKINRIIYFYKEHKLDFKRSLIFVIDDVDLITKNEMAYNVALAVEKELEVKSVIKMICIRGTTYDKYDSKTKKFFEQHFPSPYNLPRTPLSSIIQFRIDNISNKKGKNPFSKDLCDNKIDILFDGNKRASLGMLGAIIENNLPKNIDDHTSEEFIQNYIQKASVNTLILNDAFPNLHSAHLRTIPSYPVPLDIMLCLPHTTEDKIIYACVNDIAQYRSRKSKLIENGKITRVQPSHYNYSMQSLVNENLIYLEGKNIIRLTNKGKILCQYATRDHYHEKCISMLPVTDINESYLDYSRASVDHKEVVSAYQTWFDMHTVDQ